MRNAGLHETQAGIKIAGRNINNLRYADDTTLMAEIEEEWKSLLIKVKEESEKVGLKFNIQKTKIMSSSPITSWQIDGETTETVTDFVFLGSKIIVDGDHSNEIKKTLAPWKESFDKLDSILKSRDIILPTKVHIIKAMVFPVGHVWIWELDQKVGWVTKNWCFRIVVLEKALERILDCKDINPVNPKGNQPWIFIGKTDAEAEAPIL